jgi:chromosome segregation ATPase
MSEVSEATMREFFQSVVDKVAELSTQASKVEQLEQRINALNERVSGLEQENAQLRSDLNGATNTVHELSAQLNDTNAKLDVERGVSAALRETIVTRDSRVTELSGNLEQEADAHKVTLRERDEAQSEVQDLKAYVAGLKENLITATERGDHWYEVANGYERSVKELQARIDRINSVLNPLQSVASVA